MAKLSLARKGQIESRAFGGADVVVGTLVALTDDGTMHVDFPGNALGPLAARAVGAATGEPLPDNPAGTAVALVFENGDRSLPLVLGLIVDRWVAGGRSVVTQKDQRELVIDGRSLVLNAEQELVIRCGTASIQLRRDGKIVIKGTEVVSRASGANKIKGGVVNIN
jgi:hypothetical protein